MPEYRRVLRYRNSVENATLRDPLQDLIVSTEFLLAPEYVAEVLVTKHGVAAKDAVKRAQRVVAHIKPALAYLAQAFAGPADVSFLPLYYALLNLMKVYILFGPKHNQLNQNKWQGAYYDVYRKASQSLRTEEIVLHDRGAISLFYETITGYSIRTRRTIRIGDVYPYIQDVGAEWHLAYHQQNKLRALLIDVSIDQNTGGKLFRSAIAKPSGSVKGTLRNCPAIKNARAAVAGAYRFRSDVTYAIATLDADIIDRHIARFLLYTPSPTSSIVPLCTSSTLMFEELPIVLAFFHLGSVVRYNPELLARLRTSRYWPVISSLRYHGIMKFMLLFWSYIQQAHHVFAQATA